MHRNPLAVRTPGLSLQGAQVRSLIQELRFHKPCGIWPERKKKMCLEPESKEQLTRIKDERISSTEVN